MNLRPIASGLVSGAARAGKGALAGIAATAVMTLSTSIEMKLRGRESSDVPAKAAGKVLGVQPRDGDGNSRFSNIVHWSYGTAWGAIGGLIRAGISEPYASATHFVSVWGAEVTALPALQVIPPLSKWGEREVAVDVFHHMVYVGAFAGAWLLMERSQERGLLDGFRARAGVT